MAEKKSLVLNISHGSFGLSLVDHIFIVIVEVM